MKRWCFPPPRYFLANDNVLMTSRPHHRGGRNQRGRGFSNRSYDGNNNWTGGYQHQHFVTGDSRAGDRGGFNQTQPPPPQRLWQPPRHGQNQQGFNLHLRQPQQLWRSAPFNQGLRPPLQPPKELKYRNWEYAKAPAPSDSEKFIVLSYNILADYLAMDHKSKLYSHIPDHMLSWEWRKSNILFELHLWSADILCLQEVDRFHELEEELTFRGYNGIWKMRTGNAVDGCAIFWRTSRFKLVYEESIEFNKVGLRDNVAQICVLELTDQNNRNMSTGSDSPPSLSGSNRIVICNIHVLYNPKRGEIKLGQVRILLERAHAVSKLWNDAPVVLCGDFNSTPKSPLYNFISEQKLDLSEVDRDKVSGQASAQLHNRKPYNSYHDSNPSPKTETYVNLTQSPTMIDNEMGSPRSDILEHSSQGKCSEIPSVNCYSQPEYARMGSNDMPSTVEHGNISSFLNVNETDKSGKDFEESCKDETESSIPVSINSSKDNPNSSSLSNQEQLCEEFQSRLDVRNIRKDFDNTACPLEVSPPQEEQRNSSQPITNDVSSHPSTSHQTISIASTSTGYGYDKNQDGAMSSWELNEFPGGEIAGEDENSFLSALHGSETSFPLDLGQMTASNLDETFKRSASLDPTDPELHSPSNEMLDDISENLDPDFTDVDKTAYNPSLWTPMEIAAATGNAECSVLAHPLKLKSSYAEVEDNLGTRDPNGEPMATSYNRCFLGTVDYIWCSECVHTVRVLAPIARHAMEWTKGFPTKKWGSDHIALVSELALPKA